MTGRRRGAGAKHEPRKRNRSGRRRPAEEKAVRRNDAVRVPCPRLCGAWRALSCPRKAVDMAPGDTIRAAIVREGGARSLTVAALKGRDGCPLPHGRGSDKSLGDLRDEFHSGSSAQKISSAPITF